MVKITWHGHACFEIVASDGTVIVIDPHDGHSIGLKRPRVQADIVLATHDHFDHNAVNVVAKPGAKILKEFIGEESIGNIKITGIKAYHDKSKGRLRGTISVYIIEVDGLKIGHLGDIGHIPEGELAEKLKNIDVLLIPIGGVYTIEPFEAWETIKNLEPRITIPMHYWLPGMTLPLKTLDEFLGYVKFKVDRVESNSIEVSKETLPEEPKVIVLKYT